MTKWSTFTETVRVKARKHWYGLLGKVWQQRLKRGGNFTRVVSLSLVAVIGGGVVWTTLLLARDAQAATYSVANNELIQGYAPYGEVNVNPSNGTIRLQEGAVGSWNMNEVDGLQNIPSMNYGDSELVYGPNDTLYYMTIFANSCRFLKYSIEFQKWESLASAPVACGSGAKLTYDGGETIHYMPGGSSDRLYAYSIPNNSWSRKKSLPTSVGWNSSMKYVKRSNQGYLYLFRGAGSASFWRYTIATDSWESITPFPATRSVSNGIIITWDGGDSIYAISNSEGEMAQYSITTNDWTSLPRFSSYSNKRMAGAYANGKIYYTNSVTSDRMYLHIYTVATQGWETIHTNGPANVRDWTNPITYDGSRYLYMPVMPDYRQQMYRYDTINQTWNSTEFFVANSNQQFRADGVTYDGGKYAYYVGGTWDGNRDRVYRYDMETQTSSQVGGQFGTSAGYTGAFYNGKVYWGDNNSNTFISFDVDTNQFNTLAPSPRSITSGSSVVNGGDGYLYINFGGNDRRYYRYNVASNVWERLQDIPNSGNNAGGGAERIGRFIYLLHGSSTGYFSRYNMDTSTWEAINLMPNGDIDWGSALTTDGNRYVYIVSGERDEPTNRRMFRYDTQNGTWKRMANTPAATNVGAAMWYDTINNELYVAQGRQQPKTWRWSPSGADYVRDGRWYSKTMDLTQVSSWTGFNSTVTGGGSVTFYSRTSTTGRQWSEWQQVTGANIQSPKNRYLQIKAVLSGDGSTTPIISNISVDYERETDAPTLPAQFTAYSRNGGASLSTGQTYKWQHPYFTWDGANDGTGGSGIDGYYVYFGTDSGANPETAGNYQTTKNYTVTDPMTAGEVYYVRIKVKDKLGNVSQAATFFSYRYFYISPPGTITQTSDADFGAGENIDLAVNNGSMLLKNEPTGSWAEGPSDALPERSRGGASAVVDNFLYVLRGYNTSTFWRFDTVGRSWETMQPYPENVDHGSTMTWDKGNYIYAIRGNTTNDFYRYNIQDNFWEELSDLPGNATQGTGISYIGNNKIAVFFAGATEFYFYDIPTATFEIKASYPSPVRYGGSGIYYGGGDKIYAFLGADNWWNSSNNGRDMFAYYSIANDFWSSLAQPPNGGIYTQNNLVGDGSGNLYILDSDELNSTYRHQNMLKYSIADNEWKEVPEFPGQGREGFMSSDGKRYLYIVASQAGYSQKLIKYDTWDNVFYPSTPYVNALERVTWDWPSNAYNWHAGDSTTIAYDGKQYLYMLSRNQSTASYFFKYDIFTGNSVKLPSPPLYIAVNGAMNFINGDIYYSPSINNNLFYKFDLATQSWSRMNSVPVNSYRPGPSALVTVGGSAYFMPGNGDRWYRFTPDNNGGVWQEMARLPAGMVNGSAVYDEANGKIYVLRGAGTNSFYEYDIAGNSWSTRASLPANSSHGSAMVLHNGKIFSTLGNDGQTMYVYDIAENSWIDGPTAPSLARYGTNFIKINETTAKFIPSNYVTDIWDFQFPSQNTAYEGFAQHTAQPVTIQGMFDYAGIEANVTLPKNTKVEFWTRSSADGNNWEEWKISDQVKYLNGKMKARVASTPQRHTQVRVMLYSRDNLYTPIVDDYKLSYYFDVDPPQNPTTMTAYKTNAAQDELTTNVWYNNNQPYFDWPEPDDPGGATDGAFGSDMAGYWVYLGPDETATPRTAGVFVPTSEYNPTLTTSGNYFFRLQAQDITGNVDPNVYAPFVYKFDNTPPTSPNLITVTPGGYTTTNRYSFDWPAAFDGHSGVSKYCYKTGATSGPFAAEICQSERELLDVSAAYRTGTNVFYLRTLDRAGNYSTAYTTVSYYYTTDPPSPPTNLRAIPPTSSQNLFAFTWDLPALYSGDPDQLTYCYSINILPGPTNSTCTDERFIAAFKAATRQGTNIIYMVTKDEAGNVNWNNYATSNFIANTVSPGIPLNLVVTDTSDQTAGRWALTATWTKPIFEGNGISQYVVERSPDGHAFEKIGITSTTAFVDLEVEPTKTYYYRVRASDNVENTGGPSGTISGTPRGNYGSPPQIVVDPTASAESGQAIVRWATNRASTSFVYYGTTPTNLTQSKGTLDLVADHEQTVTGLLPSTVYYYRVQSFDNERSYDLQNAFSQIYSFKTAESAQVYNVEIDSITLNSAVIEWQTSVPTRTRIDYGESLAYDSSDADEEDSLSVNHIFKLENLNSGSLYHFRIVSKTELGTTIYSDDYTLRTIARPGIRNIRFQPVDDAVTASVRVTWQTNVPTTSTVRYRGSNTNQEVSSSELKTEHEALIQDLASSTDYSFAIEGRDQYGNLATSDEQLWQSGFDTRPPKISGVGVSMSTTEGASRTRAQIVVSWKTDEPSTSQVQYGKAKGGGFKETPLNTEPSTEHVVVISNLDLAEIYKIKVVSRDLSGNTVFGRQTSVVTPDKETTVLDAVLTVLQRIFRF